MMFIFPLLKYSLIPRFGLLLVCGLMVSLMLQVISSPAVYGQDEALSLTGSSPTALMNSFLAADRPDEFTDDDVGITLLAEAGDYAYASYRWGEGGGFVLMEREPGVNVWSILAADGGAPDGGDTFVGYGVSLVDSQALWEAYQREYDAVYGD